MSEALDGPREEGSSRATTRRPFLLALVPLAMFAALTALFAVQLLSGRDASDLPSALVGKPAPALALPALSGADRPPPLLPDPEARVTLVNVWASWCAPCRAEHPIITALAERPDTSVQGIAYKDAPEASLGFLRELGNPFDRIGTDESGRAGLDWGVTGVPETFVVGPDGIVRYRHRGPIDAEGAKRVVAEIEAAKR